MYQADDLNHGYRIMRCAVVDPNTGAVVNVIVADPEKDSIPDFTLVAIPDGEPIDMRWVWSEAEGFKPGPELQAELDAKQAELEKEAFDFGVSDVDDQGTTDD